MDSSAPRRSWRPCPRARSTRRSRTSRKQAWSRTNDPNVHHWTPVSPYGYKDWWPAVISINTVEFPMFTTNVKRALGAGIDRDRIDTEVYGGTKIASTSMFSGLPRQPRGARTVEDGDRGQRGGVQVVPVRPVHRRRVHAGRWIRASGTSNSTLVHDSATDLYARHPTAAAAAAAAAASATRPL